MRAATVPFAIVLLATIPCHGQIADSPTDADQFENVSLSDLLDRFESHVDRLQTANVSWTVTYKIGDGESKTEEFRTTLAPKFQATTRWTNSNKPIHTWWDDELTGQISGYSAHDPPAKDSEVPQGSATLYHDDVPIWRLFGWRSLRAYRFFANDADLSFQELCERSSMEPVITRKEGLISVEVAHAGQKKQESIGIEEIPRGTKVRIEFDPVHGYLVKRHQTILNHAASKSTITQELEVVEFLEPQDGLFVPGKVVYRASPENKEWKMEQEINFEYSGVNEPIHIDRFQFAPNMIVTERERYSEPKALGYYVVSKDRSLGPRYSDYSIAIAMLKHRMGRIDDDTLKSQLATLQAVPDVGDVAPSIQCVNLQSGEKEEISFEGRVTAIEFWSTTCGPCLGAMSMFDELAMTSRKKWPEQVQFVTIGLDTDADKVRQKIKESGWHNTHTLIDRYVDDSSSPTYPFENARRYVITAIPTCLIVDQQGRVAYRGGNITFEGNAGEEIERLLTEKD